MSIKSSTQHPAPAALTPERSPSAARRVLAALSGGVDSAVAAALLVEAGYEVIAISMLLAGNAEGHEGSCCSIDDFQDARRVADHLGIPYYVLNLREAFRSRVIDVFTTEYLHGRTPNPCLLCNRDLKFDLLWQRARELDAHFVATGHYRSGILLAPITGLLLKEMILRQPPTLPTEPYEMSRLLTGAAAGT